MRNRKEADDDDDGDGNLSDHTRSMRQALKYCRSLAMCLGKEELDGDRTGEWLHRIVPSNMHILVSARYAANAERLRDTREEAWNHFWEGNDSSDPTSPVVVIDRMSPCRFRREFLQANRPCIVRGCDKDEFRSITEAWTCNSVYDENGGEVIVNTDWFRHHMGDSTLVPIRQQPTTSSDGLDEHGRAAECTTTYIPLRDWVNGSTRCSNNSRSYLKDWHLQQYFERVCGAQNARNVQLTKISVSPLYTVPSYFQYDLLNSFLKRFTSGDYRFVYWGPAESTTPLHSDVLNSYSWSYNVCGRKRWTFYQDIRDESSRATFIQEEGDVVFVPSGWKHEVVNLQETLSVNHNWITAANLDLSWECIRTELDDVDAEWRAWDDTNSRDEDYETSTWQAREAMLRGCVGLDVSGFVFMCLVRACELLFGNDHEHIRTNLSDGNNQEKQGEFWFEVFRLRSVLRRVAQDRDIHMKKRIHAVVGSNELSQQATQLLLDFVRTIEALDNHIDNNTCRPYEIVTGALGVIYDPCPVERLFL